MPQVKSGDRLSNFAEALDGRIRSMATTQGPLSSGRWQGTFSRGQQLCTRPRTVLCESGITRGCSRCGRNWLSVCVSGLVGRSWGAFPALGVLTSLRLR
jgi:hypothetical protein